MSTTLQSFTDQVINLAASISPSELQNAEMVVESLLPVVWQQVSEKFAGDDRKRQVLKRTFDLSVVSGAVTLDSTVLTSTMEDSRLYDTTDSYSIYSYLRNYSDLFYGLDERLGFYSIEYGDRLRVVPPDVAFDPGGGETISLKLNVAAVPAIPAAAGTAIDAPDEWISDAVEATAKALVQLTAKGVAA